MWFLSGQISGFVVGAVIGIVGVSAVGYLTYKAIRGNPVVSAICLGYQIYSYYKESNRNNWMNSFWLFD